MANDSRRLIVLGGGPRPVVFLHGLFATPEHWRSMMTDLVVDYRLIAPQLPVDNQPECREKGIQNVEELTDYVVDLLDELGLPPAVICGNSLGGLVAIEICLRYPERVAGLVLAGSAGLYERNLTNGVRPRPTREFVRSVACGIFHDPGMVTEQMVDEWQETLRDRDYVRFLLRVSRATRDRSLTDELKRLKLPTLIVWGRNDQVTPPDVAESFRSQIDNAELRYIENCGHTPNLEAPAEFSKLLQDFLPSCFVGRQPIQTEEFSGKASVTPLRS